MFLRHLWALDIKRSMCYLNIGIKFDLLFLFQNSNTVGGLKTSDYCNCVYDDGICGRHNRRIGLHQSGN